MKKFEVNVHNRFLDQVVQSLHRRIATHKKLYDDLSYFDPNHFSETVSSWNSYFNCEYDMQRFAK